jgi:sec-independent protein translocase protein TatA
MFNNIGFPEILLILVAVLLLFGAKRLPEIGASFGKGIREFKRSLSDASDAIAAPEDKSSNPPSRQIEGSNQPTSGGDPKRLSQ